VRRAAAALVLALLLGVGAGAALAAEEGEAHEAAAEEQKPPLNGKKLVLQFINFGVLVAVLGWFGGKAINKALLARHEQLKADLASAAEARAAAEQRLKLHEARLASLEQEIAGIRAGIKEEAEAEKARLIAAAEDRARRIREETAFLLDQQVKEAESRLKREAADASVKVAEQILRQALDGRDQQRMVDTFVREVAGGDGAPARPPSTPGDGGASGPHPSSAPRSQV
jgi:F-type H+-transporting ATPase subunit b